MSRVQAPTPDLVGLSIPGVGPLPELGVGIKTSRPRGAAGTVSLWAYCATSPQGKTRHRGPSRCLCSRVRRDTARDIAVRSLNSGRLWEGFRSYIVSTPPRRMPLLSAPPKGQNTGQLLFHPVGAARMSWILFLITGRSLVGRESAARHHFVLVTPPLLAVQLTNQPAHKGLWRSTGQARLLSAVARGHRAPMTQKPRATQAGHRPGSPGQGLAEKRPAHSVFISSPTKFPAKI